MNDVRMMLAARVTALFAKSVKRIGRGLALG